MESALARPISFPLAPPHGRDAPRRRSREAFANNAPAPLGLARGDVLFAVGARARGPFRLLEGTFMISRTLPGARRQILDIAGPGRLIGFCAGARQDCDAVALTPAKVLPLGAAGSAQSEAMLAEIARLRDLAALLGRKTAIERLATFLLQMMGEDFRAGGRLEMPVSRQDIADHLGLVTETVSRNFLALKELGALKRAGREDVIILDIALLQKLAAGIAPENHCVD
ncbi:MAG TPA: helix-turn-helix domain-containing protein [Rhodoblastus sp.]|nr:helix-turn-helix domain-containing protein [Rhodoblastus sp.]